MRHWCQQCRCELAWARSASVCPPLTLAASWLWLQDINATLTSAIDLDALIRATDCVYENAVVPPELDPLIDTILELVGLKTTVDGAPCRGRPSALPGLTLTPRVHTCRRGHPVG